MDTSAKRQSNVRTVIKCPTCQQPAFWQENPDRPFCSRRCRMLDLGCWVDEEYRVPAEDQAGIDESSNIVE